MTATVITAAQKANIVRALDGVLPEMHAKALHDYLFTTLPALISSDIANVTQAVADVAAIKAINVATLADKALIYSETTGQLFAYDSTSVAVESLGPPATVIQPTSGAGRYLVIAVTTAYFDARLRLVADNAAVKAIDVTTLVDKALIVKEDTGEIFHYDSGSSATEILGPPSMVIQPTAGAGRYLSFTLLEKRLRVCADTAALKAIVVGGLTDKCLVYKEDTLQLFAYDADSAAAEALGPPSTVIQPTAGAGRYIALTLGGSAIPQSYFDARVRLAANAAAVKALDVTALVDKCLVYVEDLRQLYAYDSASVAVDVTGVSIEPTAGAGAYLALTDPPSAFSWFTAKQFAADPGAGDNLPAGADGTFAQCNRQDQASPCKGICEVTYIGEANPAGIDDANTAVFKIVKQDGTAMLTKTFNTATQPGAAFVATSLGTFAIAKGDVLGWEVITGATADLPKFGLQFDITPIV